MSVELKYHGTVSKEELKFVDSASLLTPVFSLIQESLINSWKISKSMPKNHYGNNICKKKLFVTVNA